MTISVPSVDSAYSAESTDGTLTISATKTVFFQCSKYTYFGAGADGAAGAVFRDTLKTHVVPYLLDALLSLLSYRPRPTSMSV